MEAIRCRVTIKKAVNGKHINLARFTTYGVKTDDRHIVTAEGYKFTAGRKAGFGKSGTWEIAEDHSALANIEGFTTGYIGVHIDQIEAVED